jgi:hypothetical protein
MIHIRWRVPSLFAVAAMYVLPNLAAAQATSTRYPFAPRPLPEAEEIALAQSAAPSQVSSNADIYVLRGTEFVKARAGTNGCSCMVGRDLHETSLYPICFDQEGSRSLLQREMMETMLRAQGLSEEQVKAKVTEALASGRLARPARPALAYMMSPKQVLFSSAGAEGRRVGAWYPHIMIAGVNMSAEQIGLAGSRYLYIQAGGESGSLHDLVVLLPVWSDDTAAPRAGAVRP